MWSALAREYTLCRRCRMASGLEARSLNDPHVVSLTYRIRHSDTVDFDRAPPVSVSRDSFRITLDASKAKVEMMDHFASEEDARKVVDPYLRAWQFEADLYYPSDGFCFIYEAAEVVDRSPPPSGRANLAAVGMSVGAARVEGFVTVHESKVAWPQPPQDLEISFDADAMRRRWLRYCKQGEPLLAAAYWALTMLEAAPGGATPSKRRGSSKKRRDASGFFNIHLDVLDKLGELVSTRGGHEEGRKAEGRALSPLEKQWVQAAFREIVRRSAQREFHGGPPPRQLTMADLPKLPYTFKN